MEYMTADGFTIDDDLPTREAEAFERGERPEEWRATESRIVNIMLPTWVIAEADAEAARINVSRSAILNMWLVEKAEQSKNLRRELTLT